MTPFTAYVALAQDNTNRAFLVAPPNNNGQMVKMAVVSQTESSFGLHSYTLEDTTHNYVRQPLFNDVNAWPSNSRIDIVVFGESNPTSGPAL
jgi:hypothetical protein